MYKIIYPNSIADKASFEDAYYKSLKNIDEASINRHLANINNNGSTIDFRQLIVLPFQDLLNWKPIITNYATRLNIFVDNKRLNIFTDLFNYTKNQPSIAEFFMNQEVIKLNACYYCGIDFINAFKDIGDYKDVIDFLNRADRNDLEKIKFIGEAASRNVINKRGNGEITKLTNSGLDRRQQKHVKDYNVGYTHNHFTLDHFLPQKDNPFYSLCLYNLVPSCYSCNTKFKNGQSFNTSNSLGQVSPTSGNYTLDKDLVFKLFYSGSLGDILTKSDFILDIKDENNNQHTSEYLKIFKLKGRYAYHKSKALHLIKQKNNYSESMIKEVSLRTGLPLLEVKKLVFGEELFVEQFTNDPFVKFKRDVARNIGIKDVLD